MNQNLSLAERSKERYPSITAAAAQIGIPKEAIKLAIHRGCDCVMSNRTLKVAPLFYSLIEIQAGEIADDERGGPFDWTRVLKPEECFRGNRLESADYWAEYEFQISRLVHGDSALADLRKAVIDLAIKAAKAEAALEESRLSAEKRLVGESYAQGFFPASHRPIQIPPMDLTKPPAKALGWESLYLWACDDHYHDTGSLSPTELAAAWPKELQWSENDPRWPKDRFMHRQCGVNDRLQPVASLLS